MKSVLSRVPDPSPSPVSPLANALAERLERGAAMLLHLASGLTEAQWQTRVPHDGRKVGVMVHHVGNMDPLEIELSQKIARGEPITGVTMATIDDINAAHAKEKDGVTKEEAIEFVRRNSEAAAAAIRALSDEELQNSATISLYDDAPLTCQFMLEDHPVRHSYHHVAKIRGALKK